MAATDNLLASGFFSIRGLPSRLLFLISSHDNPYASMAGAILSKQWPVIKQMIAARYGTANEVRIFCKQNRLTHIMTTDLRILRLFDPRVEGKASENEGITLEDSVSGLRITLVPGLKQIHTVAEGKFMLQHWSNKLKNNPSLFPIRLPKLVWKTVTPETSVEFEYWIANARIIAIDIETLRENLLIRSCSYTCLHAKTGEARTFVVNLEACRSDSDVDFCLFYIRHANNSAAPKVFQNGRYDNAYFLRFDAPVRGYLYDTYHLMHCLYPELPKTLHFISSFTLPNSTYWKDEAATNNVEYNAKDTHNTLFAWLALLKLCQRPENNYALQNYIQHEFKLVFPAIHCGQEGLLVDSEERMRLRVAEAQKKREAEETLNCLLGEENFNPGSPVQVANMMKALGYTKATGTDKKSMQEFREAHPLYEHVGGYIEDYRKAVKAISNYYDAELLHGILFYELDPGGTETSRMASRASSFWCGAQIQNQPGYCKSMYIPSPGWLFGCADGAQAESRCTGYISEDRNLIQTVETSPDFHCTNASLFFGIPFDQLYQIEHYDQEGNFHPTKVLRKDIRKLAKPVNHGSNYNMGPFVLWQTMGTKAVWEAKRILKLPGYFGIHEVCVYLLKSFMRAYPDVKGKYYDEVIEEVRRTGKLVGATGLTRRTFLQPWKSKMHLNACVAHPPQSLSVDIVNRSFYDTWYWQIYGEGRGKIRIKAQIHDEIFFMHKPQHGEEVANYVGALMARPTMVRGRQMIIPNEPKHGAARWSDLKE